MKSTYAVVDSATNTIEKILLTKPRKSGPLRTIYLCDIGSFNRLSGMQSNGQYLGDVEFIIENGVLFCKDIYELLLKRRGEEEVENKVDEIVSCAESQYPFSSDYRSIFNSLSAEQKIDALFELTFRALTRFKDKLDEERFNNWRYNR